MKKIGGNEVVEAWETGGQPMVIHHHRICMDARALMAQELVRAWGAPTAMVDVMATAHGENPPERRPATEVVLHACALVDAFWDEVTRRGWLVEVDSLK